VSLQHTPGPWELQDHRKGADCYTIAAPNRCYVVAELDHDHPEALANARLIAAAPDLLAALQGLEFAIRRGLSHEVEMESARAAIVKAGAK